MADINALYPQPPAPSSNILTDPAKVLGLLGQINQNALFQQTYKAREGIGEAYKNAIGPDGTTDEGKLKGEIARVGGFLAPEGTTAALSQEGQRISNTTNAFGLAAKQNATVTDAIGALAGNPNLKKDDLYHFAATVARNTGVPAPILNSWVNQAPKDPTKLREYVLSLRNLTMGSSGTSTLVPGAPDESGAPRVVSTGRAGFEAEGIHPNDPNAPLVPKPVTTIPITPGMRTGLAPGEAETMSAGAKQIANIQATAASSPQNHADFNMLLRDSKILGNIQGKTVQTEKAINQIAGRLKEGWGITMTPQQLAASESFPKVVEQMAAKQIAVMSDAGLRNSQAANPSLEMSQMGREGVIRMLQGNQDAIDAMRRETNKSVKAGMKPAQAQAFLSDVADKMDVQAFQFNRLSRDEQQHFWKLMSSAEAAEFKTKYKTAVDAGWVKPPKAE